MAIPSVTVTELYDVVVVGGGPAGGHLSRTLAKQGLRVVLTERVRDFSENDFSSAAVPLDTIARFALPPTVVGSHFHGLRLISTNTTHTWDSPHPLGAVLDFAMLRRFLAADAATCGADVRMGRRYIGHVAAAEGSSVRFAIAGGGEETITTRLIVDATGGARAVMSTVADLQRQDFTTATGLEYLLQVDGDTYARYAGRLTFLLGHRWAPAGYAWIFPMASNRLKVGIGIYHGPRTHTPDLGSAKHYTDRLISEHLGITSAERVDIHGGMLRFTPNFDDISFVNNVVAIGDAMSCVNPLGGEGIRHGMGCAEVAANHIAKVLAGRQRDFAPYRRDMQRRLRSTWTLSWRLARAFYHQKTDQQIDAILTHVRRFTTSEMMDILFRYRYGAVGRSVIRRYLRRFTARAWAALIHILRLGPRRMPGN